VNESMQAAYSDSGTAPVLADDVDLAPIRTVLTGGRILIVDDNAINRRVLSSMLRNEGCALLTAADGEQALELVRREPPDLILLDIMMPGMDGYQVCDHLKADPRTARIPVIFLSALSEIGSKVKGLDLGAVDYVTKPFDPAEVLARVRSQLKIQALLSEVLRANQALQEKQERLDEDLKAATAIQRLLVPSAPPSIDSLRMAWRFMPCDRVGGDLFNFSLLGEDQLALYVIDVSGHGVPAAMVTVSLSQYLSPQAGHLLASTDPAQAPRAARPSVMLRRLDAEYPMERFDKFFTIAYVIIDHRSGRLTYSLGGHPQPVLLRTDGTIEILEAGGTLIGLGGTTAFEEAEVSLQPGDRLFLYTDGLVERLDAGGGQFGEERLHDAIHAVRDLALEDACDRLVPSAVTFGGEGAPQDDITLLAVEFVGPWPAARRDDAL
jgi:sigma-B regulation protein RsbU (phosphoserine phosphatase)